jgi:hypothetical protein
MKPVLILPIRSGTRGACLILRTGIDTARGGGILPVASRWTGARISRCGTWRMAGWGVSGVVTTVATTIPAMIFEMRSTGSFAEAIWNMRGAKTGVAAAAAGGAAAGV